MLRRAPSHARCGDREMAVPEEPVMNCGKEQAGPASQLWASRERQGPWLSKPDKCNTKPCAVGSKLANGKKLRPRGCCRPTLILRNPNTLPAEHQLSETNTPQVETQ